MRRVPYQPLAAVSEVDRVFWLLCGVACCLSISTLQAAEKPPITAVAFFPTGAAALVGSQAGVELVRWPEVTPEAKWGIELHNLHDIAINTTGTLVAIAGGLPAESGSVEIRTWPGWELKHQRSDFGDCVMAVQWLSATRLAAAGMDQRLVVWDMETPAAATVLAGHSRGIPALAFLDQPQLVVTGSLDQSLRVWDMARSELKRSLTQHTQAVHALALRPAPQTPLPMLASASADRSVRLWQPTIGRMVRFVRLAAEPLAVEWSRDGQRLLAGCKDGAVHLIDPETVEVLERRRVFSAGWIFCVRAHPNDGSYLVGGSQGQLSRVVLN